MTEEREFHCDSCRDDWSFHMRRCPSDGCNGVVDDDLLVPWCCSCRRELPDGPEGPLALPAPDGAILQEDVLESEPVACPPESAERLVRTLKQRGNPN